MINYKTILIICLMENASAFPSLLPFGWRKNNASSHIYLRASLVAQLVKNPPAMRETWVRSLGWEGALEKGKAPHSSILAWRTPWTVQSTGSQSVGHDWATLTFTFHIHPKSSVGDSHMYRSHRLRTSKTEDLTHHSRLVAIRDYWSAPLCLYKPRECLLCLFSQPIF